MWTSGATFLSYIDRLHNDDDDGDVKRRSLAFIPQHTRTYTNEHRRTHTYTQSQTHTCSLTSHTRMHTHTNTHLRIQTYTHICAHTLTHTRAPASTHACIYCTYIYVITITKSLDCTQMFNQCRSQLN